MHQKKRPLTFFFLSIIFLFFFSVLVIFLPPSFVISLAGIQLSIQFAFFILLFLFIFSLSTYLFKNKKQGMLIGFFTLLFLLFQMNNLTHPFFLILLASLFVTLELFLTYRK